MKKTRWLVYSVVCVMTVLGVWGCVFAQETSPPTTKPETVVERFYTVLIQTMKKGHELGFQGRFDRLHPIILEVFDVPRMTAIVTGFSWRNLTPQQKRQLMDRFSRFMTATYAHNFGRYNGERFIQEGTAPSTQGRLFVKTKLISPTLHEPIVLNYLMSSRQGEWKIIDVYLKGSISELITRRAQFSEILVREGFDALIRKLEEQILTLSRL